LNAPEAPPFEAPWQAQIFAIAVSLNARGLFGWIEWTRALGAEIAAGPAEAGAEAYFQAWLRALEGMLAAKGVASGGELRDLAEAWREAAEATPHGRPIVLEAARARGTGGIP
jgi:nitrile hydratase accessory protein